MTKPGRNQACPCGSGKKYKHCCADKPLTFERTSNDGYSIGVPLSSAALEVMEQSKREFTEHFERPPGEGDPIFLARYLASSEDLEIEGVKLMRQAGVSPALIYAYKKTGRILTEENSRIATGAAIKEWEEAIREFEEHGDPSLKGEGAQEFDELLAELTHDVESCFYALGLAADHFFNVSLRKANGADNSLIYIQRYQSLCAARAHRTLRSISTLLKSRFSEDALKLGRAVYECYLHMVIVQEEPSTLEVLVDVPLGLRTGTHSFKKTPNGREDKRVVVELSSGRELPSAVTAYHMATRSPLSEDHDFFDYFYRLTSELIHPSVLTAEGYFSEYGVIDPVKIHLQEEAIVFCALVAAMILDRVIAMRDCPHRVARDCLTVVSRIRRRTLRVLQLLEGWCSKGSEQGRELKILRSRCDRLPEG
jgi:hypothetical protein